MNNDNFFISTIDPHSFDIAKSHDLGIEIAEFCTAWNMDDRLSETEKRLIPGLSGVKHTILHAPFNELFPCAIDPKARQLASFRFEQALKIAKKYSAHKVVIHGGFNPHLYFPIWFIEQSISFWKEFTAKHHDIEIVLENVLEPTPDMLLNIIENVQSDRLKLCLDIGHINAYSDVPIGNWVKECKNYISHFHLHNNDGKTDMHSMLEHGTIDMLHFLDDALVLCPKASFTLEIPDCAPSVNWLKRHGFIA